MTPAEAIDVSSYNGHPSSQQWGQAKGAGEAHAWIKVGGDYQSNGRPYVNPFAQAQTLGAISAGFTVAPYLWLDTRWGDQRPVIEALLDEADRIDLTGLPALDAEANAAGLGWSAIGLACETALGVMRDRRGGSCTYVNLSWWAALGSQRNPWGSFLWLADPSHPNTPQVPCDAHQYGESAMPGFSGSVDRDRIYNPAVIGQEDDMLSATQAQQLQDTYGMTCGLEIDSIYQRRLHRPPEQTGRDWWAYRLATSGEGAVAIEAAIVAQAKADGETVYA